MVKNVIVFMTVIFFSGCGFGYSVYYTEYSDKDKAYKYYSCREIKPAFWFDNTVAICDLKEECNKICDTERSKNK